ncbi:hypothetical protein [Streptomyces sp. NBC_00470]|uniref:hypothetical protein n=1 Tax=Streptomyces sp. NBC_00470 TaxID=2975753 RepID=UPI0030E4F90B
MPTPLGQTDATDHKFALRMTEAEDRFVRSLAHDHKTSLNTVIRRCIQDAMPPADPRQAAIDAIHFHWSECTLCTPQALHPQCTEGRKLQAAYAATVPAPPPAKKKSATAGRRSLGTGMDPVPPVKGQVPFEEGESK